MSKTDQSDVILAKQSTYTTNTEISSEQVSGSSDKGLECTDCNKESANESETIGTTFELRASQERMSLNVAYSKDDIEKAMSSEHCGDCLQNNSPRQTIDIDSSIKTTDTIITDKDAANVDYENESNNQFNSSDPNPTDNENGRVNGGGNVENRASGSTESIGQTNNTGVRASSSSGRVRVGGRPPLPTRPLVMDTGLADDFVDGEDEDLFIFAPETVVAETAVDLTPEELMRQANDDGLGGLLEQLRVRSIEVQTPQTPSAPPLSTGSTSGVETPPVGPGTPPILQGAPPVAPGAPPPVHLHPRLNRNDVRSQYMHGASSSTENASVTHDDSPVQPSGSSLNQQLRLPIDLAAYGRGVSMTSIRRMDLESDYVMENHGHSAVRTPSNGSVGRGQQQIGGNQGANNGVTPTPNDTGCAARQQQIISNSGSPIKVINYTDNQGEGSSKETTKIAVMIPFKGNNAPGGSNDSFNIDDSSNPSTEDVTPDDPYTPSRKVTSNNTSRQEMDTNLDIVTSAENDFLSLEVRRNSSSPVIGQRERTDQDADDLLNQIITGRAERGMGPNNVATGEDDQCEDSVEQTTCKLRHEGNKVMAEAKNRDVLDAHDDSLCPASPVEHSASDENTEQGTRDETSHGISEIHSTSASFGSSKAALTDSQLDSSVRSCSPCEEDDAHTSSDHSELHTGGPRQDMGEGCGGDGNIFINDVDEQSEEKNNGVNIESRDATANTNANLKINQSVDSRTSVLYTLTEESLSSELMNEQKQYVNESCARGRDDCAVFRTREEENNEYLTLDKGATNESPCNNKDLFLEPTIGENWPTQDTAEEKLNINQGLSNELVCNDKQLTIETSIGKTSPTKDIAEKMNVNVTNPEIWKTFDKDSLLASNTGQKVDSFGLHTNVATAVAQGSYNTDVCQENKNHIKNNTSNTCGFTQYKEGFMRLLENIEAAESSEQRIDKATIRITENNQNFTEIDEPCQDCTKHTQKDDERATTPQSYTNKNNLISPTKALEPGLDTSLTKDVEEEDGSPTRLCTVDNVESSNDKLHNTAVLNMTENKDMGEIVVSPTVNHAQHKETDAEIQKLRDIEGKVADHTDDCNFQDIAHDSQENKEATRLDLSTLGSACLSDEKWSARSEDQASPPRSVRDDKKRGLCPFAAAKCAQGDTTETTEDTDGKNMQEGDVATDKNETVIIPSTDDKLITETKGAEELAREVNDVVNETSGELEAGPPNYHANTLNEVIKLIKPECMNGEKTGEAVIESDVECPHKKASDSLAGNRYKIGQNGSAECEHTEVMPVGNAPKSAVKVNIIEKETECDAMNATTVKTTKDFSRENEFGKIKDILDENYTIESAVKTTNKGHADTHMLSPTITDASEDRLKEDTPCGVADTIPKHTTNETNEELSKTNAGNVVEHATENVQSETVEAPTPANELNDTIIYETPDNSLDEIDTSCARNNASIEAIEQSCPHVGDTICEATDKTITSSSVTESNAKVVERSVKVYSEGDNIERTTEENERVTDEIQLKMTGDGLTDKTKDEPNCKLATIEADITNTTTEPQLISTTQHSKHGTTEETAVGVAPKCTTDDTASPGKLVKEGLDTPSIEHCSGEDKVQMSQEISANGSVVVTKKTKDETVVNCTPERENDVTTDTANPSCLTDGRSNGASIETVERTVDKIMIGADAECLPNDTVNLNTEIKDDQIMRDYSHNKSFDDDQADSTDHAYDTLNGFDDSQTTSSLDSIQQDMSKDDNIDREHQDAQTYLNRNQADKNNETSINQGSKDNNDDVTLEDKENDAVCVVGEKESVTSVAASLEPGCLVITETENKPNKDDCSQMQPDIQTSCKSEEEEHSSNTRDTPLTKDAIPSNLHQSKSFCEAHSNNPYNETEKNHLDSTTLPLSDNNEGDAHQSPNVCFANNALNSPKSYKTESIPKLDLETNENSLPPITPDLQNKNPTEKVILEATDLWLKKITDYCQSPISDNRNQDKMQTFAAECKSQILSISKTTKLGSFANERSEGCTKSAGHTDLSQPTSSNMQESSMKLPPEGSPRTKPAPRLRATRPSARMPLLCGDERETQERDSGSLPFIPAPPPPRERSRYTETDRASPQRGVPHQTSLHGIGDVGNEAIDADSGGIDKCHGDNVNIGMPATASEQEREQTSDRESLNLSPLSVGNCSRNSGLRTRTEEEFSNPVAKHGSNRADNSINNQTKQQNITSYDKMASSGTGTTINKQRTDTNNYYEDAPKTQQQLLNETWPWQRPYPRRPSRLREAVQALGIGKYSKTATAAERIDETPATVSTASPRTPGWRINRPSVHGEMRKGVKPSSASGLQDVTRATSDRTCPPAEGATTSREKMEALTLSRRYRPTKVKTVKEFEREQTMKHINLDFYRINRTGPSVDCHMNPYVMGKAKASVARQRAKINHNSLLALENCKFLHVLRYTKSVYHGNHAQAGPHHTGGYNSKLRPSATAGHSTSQLDRTNPRRGSTAVTGPTTTPRAAWGDQSTTQTWVRSAAKTRHGTSRQDALCKATKVKVRPPQAASWASKVWRQQARETLLQ